MGKKHIKIDSVAYHVEALINQMSEGLFEKRNIMSLAFLSAIAGESIFLLGPPGTAKSMVARRLKLAFKDAEAFEYLMSRFSVPDEVFGPVSISKLKDYDIYERKTKGYLPSASIVFLDEIWKASPAILNSLLTAINEKTYRNGDSIIRLPMKALISASNELPEEDEGLGALWDRFLVRITSGCIDSEATFYEMVRQQKNIEPVIDEALTIDEEKLGEWQREICEVEISDDVCRTITTIRKSMKTASKDEKVDAMDYYISDRRWKKCFHLMQTSAFLNGRNNINSSDILILCHCLWNKEETQDVVKDIVVDCITKKYIDQVAKIEYELSATIDITEQLNNNTSNIDITTQPKLRLWNYMYYEVSSYPQKRCLISKFAFESLQVDKQIEALIYDDTNRVNTCVIFIPQQMNNSYSALQCKTVKICKKSDGKIIIDNCMYYLVTERSVTINSLINDIEESNDMKESRNKKLEDLRKQVLQLKADIEPMRATIDNNIFVSSDIKKYAKTITKKTLVKIEATEIRILNATTL